jgi:hypothetical protein
MRLKLLHCQPDHHRTPNRVFDVRPIGWVPSLRTSTVSAMNEFLIGYARVSTNEQDLTAQRSTLEARGVRSNLIFTDHGLSGTNRA